MRKEVSSVDKRKEEEDEEEAGLNEGDDAPTKEDSKRAANVTQQVNYGLGSYNCHLQLKTF